MSGQRGSSRLSLWSESSLLSVGSRGSVLSIGSVGSVLSIGSVGAAGSVLAIGTAGGLGSVLSSLSRWSMLSFRSDRAVMGAGESGRLPAAVVGVAVAAVVLAALRAPRSSGSPFR